MSLYLISQDTYNDNNLLYRWMFSPSPGFTTRELLKNDVCMVKGCKPQSPSIIEKNRKMSLSLTTQMSVNKGGNESYVSGPLKSDWFTIVLFPREWESSASCPVLEEEWSLLMVRLLTGDLALTQETKTDPWPSPNYLSRWRLERNETSHIHNVLFLPSCPLWPVFPNRHHSARPLLDVKLSAFTMTWPWRLLLWVSQREELMVFSSKKGLKCISNSISTGEMFSKAAGRKCLELDFNMF